MSMVSATRLALEVRDLRSLLALAPPTHLTGGETGEIAQRLREVDDRIRLRGRVDPSDYETVRNLGERIQATVRVEPGGGEAASPPSEPA